MQIADKISRGAAAAFALAFIVMLTARPAQSQTETVIHDFCTLPHCADGYYPTSNLIMDSAGNMYSTTLLGGTKSWGTVFELAIGGTPTVLYTFCSVGGNNVCTDGGGPASGLVMDSAGNLYGTTHEGGTHGLTQTGTLFKLGSDGTLTTLHNFQENDIDGYSPDAGLVMDAKGNLYGTTYQGGEHNDGVVYKVAPNGRETILHSFGATSTDGSGPANVVLVMDKQGNLYGTTAYGGTNDEGTVFKVTAAGVESILYNFGASRSDGITPEAGLTIDSEGNLYGTTVYGGRYEDGTVFRLSRSGTEAILHSFQNNGTDGYNPYAAMIRDSAGNLYGVTYNGGKTCGFTTCGTVFEISPTGVETTLHDFADNGTDGIEPQGSLWMDSEGHLFGTTVTGGTGNLGAVFEITP